MKKYGTILSICILLILWQLAALSIDNDFLMPYPLAVISTMWEQCLNSSFYTIVLQTILRSLFGLGIAFFCSGICAFLSYFYPFIKAVLAPFILLTKSVPNISYIIIVLVWFSSQSSAIIITFLILFPILYANFYEGLLTIHQNLQDVLRLYPESNWTKIHKFYLPMLIPAINAGLSSGLGLAFKVGVMAEIIGQVQYGIGRQLNVARLNMDMTSIFAWTFWIIILLMLMEFIRKQVMLRIQK